MNRREKETTGRRIEEGRKNLERRIGIKNTKIMNWINKKMNCIKKQEKKKNNLIWFIGIAIALTVSIVCICRCCSLESTNAVIALVGIVLAFIGIFLSYKGLMVTNEVKEDIAFQQYKIKQQEEVAKLVVAINRYRFSIDCGSTDADEGGGNYVKYRHVNLSGVKQVNDYLINEKPELVDSKVYLGDSIRFEPFEELSTSAFMPAPIAAQLNPFCRVVCNEANNQTDGNCAFLYMGDDSDDNWSHPLTTFPDWKTFVNVVDKLITSVEEWFSKEHNNIKPNIIPHAELAGSDADLHGNYMPANE